MVGRRDILNTMDSVKLAGTLGIGLISVHIKRQAHIFNKVCGHTNYYAGILF